MKKTVIAIALLLVLSVGCNVTQTVMYGKAIDNQNECIETLKTDLATIKSQNKVLQNKNTKLNDKVVNLTQQVEELEELPK